MTNIYKYAAKNNILFQSPRGALSVSDLFQLPLSGNNGFNLDTVARNVNSALKAVSEESFVAKTNPNKAPLEIALEVVKDIIADKLAAAEAATLRRAKAEERTKILDALEQKEGQVLASSSVEELRAKLAALDAE